MQDLPVLQSGEVLGQPLPYALSQVMSRPLGGVVKGGALFFTEGDHFGRRSR